MYTSTQHAVKSQRNSRTNNENKSASYAVIILNIKVICIKIILTHHILIALYTGLITHNTHRCNIMLLN